MTFGGFRSEESSLLHKVVVTKYCSRGVMPDTRPGMTFDDEGVCSACNAYEKRKLIDWESGHKEFEQLCDKYRGCNGNGGTCQAE